MAQEIVRIAVDVVVSRGSAKAAEEISYELRKEIGNYITGSLIPAHAEGGGIEAKVAAGASHVHDTSGGYCEYCDRWTRALLLDRV
jgi:hypothetical protein